jgi:hypothetical protein
MPPLKFYSDDQIDLEFGPLILADEIIIDAEAFDAVLQSKSSKLARLRNSVRELYESGYLTTAKYRDVVLSNKNAILDLTTSDLRNPLLWLPAVRDAVVDWEATRPLFRRAFPRRYDNALHYPYGVYCAMLENGIQPNEEAYQKLRKILFSGKILDDSEIDLVKVMASPYLNYVNSNLVLMNDLEAPPIDWSTLKSFYREKMRAPIESRTSRLQAKVRELFVAAPSWEPSNVYELLSILNHRHVVEVREYLTECVDNGRAYDAGYVTNLLGEVRVRHNASRKLQLSLAVASASLSSVSAMFAAPLSLSPAAGVVRAVGERWIGKEHRWLYCLLDAKSASIPRGVEANNP